MASRDDQYDPYIPAGGAPAGRSGGQGGAKRPEDIQQVRRIDFMRKMED